MDSVEQGSLFDRLLELDQAIDAGESDGLTARWQFGQEVLTQRVGKKLPDGLLDDIAESIGKGRAEVKRRVLFAVRFPTQELLDHVMIQYGSWYRVVNEALASTAHISGEKDEWATPKGLFEALDAEFSFTLDVCAHAGNAKCDRFFGPKVDGLQQSWAGEVAFMNPPYSAVAAWMEKAFLEASDATVVCLVPSRTDVGWFWDYARHGEVRFLRGRLHFVDDAGNTGPAPFPSAVVVFGPDQVPSVVWFEP